VDKLLRLKEWLSLDDAARRLEIAFGESVSVADLLQLGLEGSLKISVRFVNREFGKVGWRVPYNQSKKNLVELGSNGFALRILHEFTGYDDELPGTEDLVKSRKLGIIVNDELAVWPYHVSLMICDSVRQ